MSSGISDMVFYLLPMYILDMGMLFAVIERFSKPYHIVYF